MKKSITLLIIIFATLLFSCKKDTQPSFEIISLLQNKWTLISEAWIYPANSTYNVSYTGISTDYYLFNTRDTLLINQAGDPVIVNNPKSLAIKYSVNTNNSVSLYDQLSNSTVVLTIQKISNDSLILTNDITATFTNNGGNTQTTYNGTRTVILKK